MRGTRAFTLIELLNVIAIIAILSAIFLPVIKAVKGAAYRYNASMGLKSLGAAVNIYMADHDETYPIAMSYDSGGFRAWFGWQQVDGKFDPKSGILSAYTKGRAARDMTHRALDYLGDQSGYGYNWGYLGSDINITLDYSGWPNCYRPARSSEVYNSAIVFGTSSFYSAPWLRGGDGQIYDFGFIDPPKYWWGNPNVDFRHGDPPIYDIPGRNVTPQGMAVLVFTSGNVKAMSPNQLKDKHFERGEPSYEQ
jgi:prepilin-type N-terminal cleavage/methylation domain-containing protein